MDSEKLCQEMIAKKIANANDECFTDNEGIMKMGVEQIFQALLQ
jgi:hypothetical protein